MRPLADLLQDLHRRGVELWVDGVWLRYRAPKGALTAELQQEVRDRKDEIRDLLNGVRDASGAGGLPPLTPVPRDAPIPLSFEQERLWWIEQSKPGSAAYHLPAVFPLSGAVDVPVLEQCLNLVVHRHEILRTRFPAVGGRPVQVVEPELNLVLSQSDLRALPDAQRQTAAQALAWEEVSKPFDLEAGPLLRASIVHLSDTEHLLRLTMHHLIGDGWSCGLIQDELAALYPVIQSGGMPSLPPLPIQYADYAVAQRRALSARSMEREVSFWLGRLSHVAPLHLPIGRERPLAPSFRGGRHPLALTSELSDGLENLVRREAATPFMGFLTMLCALIYHHSRETDPVVGTPAAGRREPETEGLIGYFINLLPLRPDLSGDPTIRQLLGRVRRVCLEAYTHQDLPFSWLEKALEEAYGPEYRPLFRVALFLVAVPEQARELPGLVIGAPVVLWETVRSDLELHLWKAPEQYQGYLLYSRDRFDPTDTARLAGDLIALLGSALSLPDTPISQLPLRVASGSEGEPRGSTGTE